MLVKDEPGVIAAITETLAEVGVSIDSFLQRPAGDTGSVPIVLTTHSTPEADLQRAVSRIAALPQVLQPPRMLRIAPI
jgi:homoserine dehydrogenase